MAKLKVKATRSRKRFTQDDLSMLFNLQIATLTDRGVPREIADTLKLKKDTVISIASNLRIGKGNTPFLPVIHQAYLGYYGLMSMVRNGSKIGCTYLDPLKIQEVAETRGIYYIYDVEDGAAILGTSPDDAIEIFMQQDRLTLTTVEAIALTIHTDVLIKHNMWVTASLLYESYKPRNSMLRISTLPTGQPVLSWGYSYVSINNFGSPSCVSR